MEDPHLRKLADLFGEWEDSRFGPALRDLEREYHLRREAACLPFWRWHQRRQLSGEADRIFSPAKWGNK